MKILLLGSGGLSIGQAGEFDYSGTQAKQSFLEEGHEVIIVNPNIATVQTDPDPGCKVYLYPVEAEYVARIIELERPDGIVGGFGGQAALACLLALDESGTLEKYGVKNYGCSTDTLRITEDRDLFAQKMRELSIPIPPSHAASTLPDAITGANQIGYPVIIRAAYALGGLGSGFAANDDELTKIVSDALTVSPQVLIEKSLKGWKELEYEVMRDAMGNAITICNMENIDPLGIHTGDSIVVAPSQTLTDEEYHTLRTAALKIVNGLNVLGECNVQFALSPEKLEFFVIEVNARLSRSSALASKATGYPIASVAAKVVLGHLLPNLKNPVNGTTCAFFEPALDYITVKIPKWDLEKFRGASRSIGSAMKSVGEVMAIGRTFSEAFQKAMRMVLEDDLGLYSSMYASTINHPLSEVEQNLLYPTDQRIFWVFVALRNGMSIQDVHRLTRMDMWFLHHFEAWIVLQNQCIESISKCLHENKAKHAQIRPIFQNWLGQLNESTLSNWKREGFSDGQLTWLFFEQAKVADLFRQTEIGLTTVEANQLLRERRLQLKVVPHRKQIDTTSGEHPASSNYFFITYSASEHDHPCKIAIKKPSALFLGSGPYHIGSSVEFDWSAVSASREAKRLGFESILLNCNPETVSTDFNISDRLYFDELSAERIQDIIDIEHPEGVVTCFAGQTGNRLIPTLSKLNVPLLGHPSQSIETAENRSLFSKLCDHLEIPQPRWVSATDPIELNEFIEKVGFPVIVRPSFVLSGSAMSVATDSSRLTDYLSRATHISKEYPVVISEFYTGAKEIEVDAVAHNGQVVQAVVSVHIENAGVHSGDATVLTPAVTLSNAVHQRCLEIASLFSADLKLNGPFNIQLLSRRAFKGTPGVDEKMIEEVSVIELNARAARTFPHVSKTMGVQLSSLATRCILSGLWENLLRSENEALPGPPSISTIKSPKPTAAFGSIHMPIDTKHRPVGRVYGIKSPLFSFNRLAGADPILGVEMSSTGEVGCIHPDVDEAMKLALLSAKFKKPTKGILISAGSEAEKKNFMRLWPLVQKLGIQAYATSGTYDFLIRNGISNVKRVSWQDELQGELKTDVGSHIETKRQSISDSVLSIIQNRLVDLVFNIPKNFNRDEVTRGTQVRLLAVRVGCTVIVNSELFDAYLRAMTFQRPTSLNLHCLEPYEFN